MKQILSVEEYDKKLSELEESGDTGAYLDFLHNYSCIYGNSIPKSSKQIKLPKIPNDYKPELI